MNADIAFFLQNLAGGGAERAIVALAGEIAHRGHTVDLVLGDARSDYASEIAAAVNVVDFSTHSPLVAFRRLVAYLHRCAPRVAVAALDTPNIMLVLAAKLAGFRGRIVVSQRAVIDASHRELTSGRRLLTKVLQRLFFPHADAIISNSFAAAAEVREQLGVAQQRIFTIHNALDAVRIDCMAHEPLGHHPSLGSGMKLIVSVGSLTKRKDMGTLVTAFRSVKDRRPAHLVIVGKGDERSGLEALIHRLDLDGFVHLPGFDANPYKWMAAADVFVSSSTGEGFPNVIAEALALGKAIVATDCPGDTAELLEHGKWGRLVPVGDAQRMADAIVAALDDPDLSDGRIRAADFTPATITAAYLNVLLPS